MKTQAAAMFIAGLAGAVALAPAARADVKVETATHFGGVVGGIGQSDEHSVEYYQGEKYREENNIKMTGAVGGAVQKWFMHEANGNQSVNIYRVDRNLRYSLDTDKHTYTESPIYTPTRSGYRPTQPSSGGSETSQSGQPQQNDTRITKSDFKVQDTGRTRTLNGFTTHEYLVSWDLETEDMRTHEIGKSLVVVDLWNTQDARFAALRREKNAYDRAYARLLRISPPTDMAAQPAFQKLAIMNAGEMRMLGAKLSQIKGYPVVTDVKWDVACGGKYANSGCSGSGQQAQSQSAPSSPNISGGLGGMLSGFLAQKAEQKVREKAAGEVQSKTQDTNGMYILTRFRIEVRSVDTGSLPASLFEVPAGYTRS
jgi:hypothetical protein